MTSSVYSPLILPGRQGYVELMEHLTRLGDELSEDIQSIGDGNVFKLVSTKGCRSLPIVVWKLKSARGYNEFSVAAKLKALGWLVPAYTIHAGAVEVKLMRVVVRSDLTSDRKQAFVKDLTQTKVTEARGYAWDMRAGHDKQSSSAYKPLPMPVSPTR
nr:glutamate decarboxylase [Quercus suber]